MQFLKLDMFKLKIWRKKKEKLNTGRKRNRRKKKRNKGQKRNRRDLKKTEK